MVFEARFMHTFDENPRAENLQVRFDVTLGSTVRWIDFDSFDEFIKEDQCLVEEELFQILMEFGCSYLDAEFIITSLVMATNESINWRESFGGTISVSLYVYVSANDDQIEEVIQESFYDAEIRFRPASKFAIESLNRTKFKKQEVATKKCTICLEKFVAETQVAYLPCGHMFHDECIVEWLMTSHLCPLCRYELHCEPESDR